MSAQVDDLKLVLVGDTGVGKTCCVRRATSGIFDNNSKPTLGASFTAKYVEFKNKSYRLQIWDTAGQERYKSMTPMYFRGSRGAIIMYSITDVDSFRRVDEWVDQLKENKEILIFLVGNKIDCIEDRAVSTEEGEKKAEEIGATFAEVSAKTGAGIDDLFSSIPIQIITSMNESMETNKKDINIESDNKEKGGCC